MAKLDDLNPAARRGYALALGSLAPRVLGAEEMDQEEPEQELVIDEETGEMSGGGGGGAMRRLEAVIQGLAKAATCLQEDKEERDAELERACYSRTLFEWAHPAVARYCRRHALAYPELDAEGEIVGPVPRV